MYRLFLHIIFYLILQEKQLNNLSVRNLGVSGGAETHTLTVGEIPAHSHSLKRRPNADAGTYDIDNLRKAESSAITSDRLEDVGDFNTRSTGSGNAHNNMQPYVVLRYLIKY